MNNNQQKILETKKIINILENKKKEWIQNTLTPNEFDYFQGSYNEADRYNRTIALLLGHGEKIINFLDMESEIKNKITELTRLENEDNEERQIVLEKLNKIKELKNKLVKWIENEINDADLDLLCDTNSLLNFIKLTIDIIVRRGNRGNYETKIIDLLKMEKEIRDEIFELEHLSGYDTYMYDNTIPINYFK